MEPITILAILAAAAGVVTVANHETPEKKAERKRKEKERCLKACEAVSQTPWWLSGIPRKVSLVLDSDVLEDNSQWISYWFRMIVDNAEERDWNVVILNPVYQSVMSHFGPYQGDKDKLIVERFSRLQTLLGSRMLILPKVGGMAEYMRREKSREDVYFTMTIQNKITLMVEAARNGIELAHEVRSPENLKLHESYYYGGNVGVENQDAIECGDSIEHAALLQSLHIKYKAG